MGGEARRDVVTAGGPPKPAGFALKLAGD